MGVALKRLRDLRASGAKEVLDLENQVRLLLMGSGGSMAPFRKLLKRLFSAANGLNHCKDFRALLPQLPLQEPLYRPQRQRVHRHG